MAESPYPPCIDIECEHNFNGLCQFLNAVGGNEKEMCSWFRYITDKKCDECFYSVTREGKKLRFCKLKNKSIPPKPDACAHWKGR